VSYTFYIKVTTIGPSTATFGPWELRVGCTSDTVSYTTNSGFDVDKPIYVGDSTSNVYTFALPTATRSYCSAIKNEIYTNSDVIWPVASPKLIQCSSNPCNVFSLVDTINPEVITFKVFSTFYGDMTLLSPTATITITCSAAYVISATTVVD